MSSFLNTKKYSHYRKQLREVRFPLLSIILLITISLLVFKYVTREQNKLIYKKSQDDLIQIKSNLDKKFFRIQTNAEKLIKELNPLSTEDISKLKHDFLDKSDASFVVFVNKDYQVANIFCKEKQLLEQKDKLLGLKLQDLSINIQSLNINEVRLNSTLQKVFGDLVFSTPINGGYLFLVYSYDTFIKDALESNLLNNYDLYISTSNKELVFNTQNDINFGFIDPSLTKNFQYSPPINSFDLIWDFKMKPSFTVSKFLLPYSVLILSLSSAFLLVFVLFYKAREQKQNEIILKLQSQLDQENSNNNKTVKGLRLLAKRFREEFEASKKDLVYQRSSAYRVMCEALKSKKEKELAEKSLQENISRLMIALESTQTGTWTWNIRENQIIWDDQTHELFDLSPQTFLGTYENLLNLIHSEDRNKFDIELRNALANEDEIESEFRVPQNHYRERVLRLKGKIYRDANHKPIHITGTVIDISDEVQKRTMMSKFFSLSVDLFCVANNDGYFTQLSPTWVDTLGYSMNELMGHPFMYFVHPDDRKRTQAEFQILVSQGHRTVNFENRYRNKDGTYRVLLWNAVSIDDSKTIYAIARDITELKSKKLRTNQELSYNT